MKPRIIMAMRDISEAGDFMKDIANANLLSEFSKWSGYSFLTIKRVAAEKLPTPSYPMSKVLLKLKYQYANWKTELESVNAPERQRLKMTYKVKKLLMETFREHCYLQAECGKHCIHYENRDIICKVIPGTFPSEWTDEDIDVMING